MNNFKIDSPNVSTFRDAFDTIPHDRPLADVLQIIKSDSLKSRVLYLRKLLKNDEKAYRREKTKLPAVTFAGTFTRRDAEHFHAPSGFMVCDVDHIQDARGVKELVGYDEHVKAAFISPSGAGVKFLVSIPILSNVRQFESVFNQVSQYFFDTYGIELDPSGKDAPRLCFLSYDPETIVNDDKDVTRFDIDLSASASEEWQPEREAAVIHDEDSPEFKTAVLQVLSESEGVVNTYEDFFRVMAACKREGVAYEVFDAICQKSNGYDASGNLRAWTKFDPAVIRYDSEGKPLKESTFGTLYAYATKTDEQRQRLNALLPVMPAEYASYTVTDDMILQAARIPTDPPAFENVQDVRIDDHLWMSDLRITLTDPLLSLRTEIDAPCGYGKTAAIRQIISDIPEKWVVILTPTTPLRTQICQNFPEFIEIKEGDEFPENGRVFVCTREKFVASYPQTRLESCETFVIPDEIHLNTIDISYKGAMLAKLEDRLSYCRTLELTGTPIRFPHHTHPAVMIRRKSHQAIYADFTYYNDTIPTIRDIVKESIAFKEDAPVFFLNDKDAIREAGGMLLSYCDIPTAERRPYEVFRDENTGEISADAAILQNSAAIPDDCLCILCTSLIECGVNIESHAGAVAIFPRHKDHTTRRQALSLHLPHEIIQSVSRFRKGWERILIMIPSYQKTYKSIFDYQSEYEEHLSFSDGLVTRYNKQREAKKYYRHIAAVRGDLSPEIWSYIRFSERENRYVRYEKGIDFLLLESMRQAMTHDPVYYVQELAKGLTPVLIKRVVRMTGTLSQDEREEASDIRDGIEANRAIEWSKELDRLASEAETLKDDAVKVSRAERWVSVFARMMGKDAAVKVVRHVGDNEHALQTLRKQARFERYEANRETVKVKSFEALRALIQSQKEWESREFMKKGARIFRGDPFLCHMVTGKKQIETTANRGARIIESMAGTSVLIKKVNGKTVRTYAIDTLSPFRDIVFKVTGKRLEEFFEWDKYCKCETPETLEQRAEAGKKPCYTFDIKALDTPHESVTEFASEQIRIHGNVF